MEQISCPSVLQKLAAEEAYLCLPSLPCALEAQVAQAGRVAQRGPSDLGGERDAADPRSVGPGGVHRAQHNTSMGLLFDPSLLSRILVAVACHHLPLSPGMPMSPFCPGGPGMAP